MTTITEDYVSFETAKLLREKGFKEPTLAYAYGQDMVAYYSQPKVTDDYNVEAGRYPLPTLQMAMKWLREVHNVNIEIHYNRFEENYKYLIIYKPEVLDDIRSLGVYHYYEDATESAIKYCLENLI